MIHGRALQSAKSKGMNPIKKSFGVWMKVVHSGLTNAAPRIWIQVEARYRKSERSPCTIPNCETRSRPRVSTMANEKAKKKATKKVEKAVWKAVKKGATEGAVEKAVSQGLANGARKKPVGKAAAAADAQEAKKA